MDSLTLIKGTPWWVWGVLGYVIALGIYFLKDRTSSLRTLVLAPVIIIAWSLFAVKGHYGLSVYSLGIWCVGIIIGSIFGWMFSVTHPPRLIDASKALFIIPGSAAFLGIFLSFFLLRYIRGAAFSINPALMHEPRIILLDITLSGLLVGFMVGRTAMCFKIYRKAS